MMASYRWCLAAFILATAACTPRAPTPSSPRADRPARPSPTGVVAATVFTDSALFRRVCYQADSGLTAAARRCTPRDQSVVVQ